MTAQRNEMIDSLHSALGFLGISRDDVDEALSSVETLIDDINTAVRTGGNPQDVVDQYRADLTTQAEAKAATAAQNDDPFVKFPRRTGAEMKALFEVPFMDMLREHGVMLLTDPEFNSVLEFALADAATPSEFIAIFDDLYFSTREEQPTFVSQRKHIDVDALRAAAADFDASVMNNPMEFIDSYMSPTAEDEFPEIEDQFKLYPYQNKIIEDLKTWADERDDTTLTGAEPMDVPHENIFSENFMDDDLAKEDGAEDVAEDTDEEDSITIVMGGFSNGGDMTPALRELNRILETVPAGSVEITAVVKPYLDLNMGIVNGMFASIKDELG